MLIDPQKNLSIFFGPAITSPPADEYLEEGKPHRIGELEFRVLHIPGHSPGGVCLYRDNTAIVGDAVFNGSIGRTDFPGGSLESLLGNIKNKILALGDKVKIYPGHGPPTTVAQERKFNPFLRE